MIALLLAGSLVSGASGPQSCESLKSINLPDVTITSAETVPAGPYLAPAAAPPPAPAGRGPAPVAPGAPAGRGGRGGPPAPQPIPLAAHCRLAVVLTPSPDSHIESEIWLPVENWNGKLEVVGGGGWAGAISYGALATAVNEGYAAASTDTGHKGGTGDFAYQHPEKIVDFGYRAVHETTAKAKLMIAAFYARAPRMSYFNGCSTGGRQALMEAQRFPDDFDGIIAGAPANSHIHLHTAAVARGIDMMKTPAVSPEKIAMVGKAVLNACDALDGVKDGLVSNPRACHFDPASLLCKGPGDDVSQSCLTAGELASVQRAYAPTKFKNGTTAWAGNEFGSEGGWARIGGANPPAPTGGAVDTIRFLGYQTENWDWHTFDLDKDTAVIDKNAGFIDSVDPNLAPFKAHGGKLILYHGWADVTINPGHTIDYYQSVLSKMGGKQDDFVRLFMEPGMQHCGNGPGPNQISWMASLERWRESGSAPEQILASHVSSNRVDMTRPLCPYPQVAAYKGVGSTNDAANFVCKAP